MLTFFELCGAQEDIRFSPFVWRIKLMLAHKDIPYDSKAITFLDKSALEGSGLKTVPVIKHDDTWVSESLEIARYLDENFSGNNLFETSSAVLQAAIINNWVDRNIVMPIFPMIVTDIYDALDDANKEYFKDTREPRLGGRKIEDMRSGREDLRTAFKAKLGPLESMLQGSPYLSGSAPAFLDYCMMGSLMWPHIISDFDPIIDSAPLKDWRDRMFDLFDGLAKKAPRAV